MTLWKVDQLKTSALNLRRGVVPAEVLAVLPAGTRVEKLAEVGAAPGWWQVRAHLGAATVEGFVNSAYLSATSSEVDGPALAVPPAHLPPRGHRRRDSHGRAYPLDEPGMPLRSGAHAGEVLAILNWLQPDNPGHARWQPGGGKTFCNIYAYDYAQRMGVYLPRVWWTGTALAKLAQGAQVPVEYGTSVTELNANALHDWFPTHGAGFGWVQVFSVDALQRAANEGKAAFIVARRKDTNRSGHISAVVPETAQIAAARKGGVVQRPVESQAGGVNFTARVQPGRWWLGEKFSSFGFWCHE